MEERAKKKGDLLELVVGRLCSGIKNAKSTNDVKIVGRSGVARQIDTLIVGTVGAFEIRIIVDSKNYAQPVDINDVESMSGMVLDVGANLGVIVCPSGFTDGAKKRAETAGIQLYEIYDQALGNSNSLIPIRWVEARIDKYQFHISESSTNPFSIPADQARWIFHIDGQLMKPNAIPTYLWNKELVPQKEGHYTINVGAVKLGDTQEELSAQYCDLAVSITVAEDYYLKLFPASFIRKTGEIGKDHHDFRIDVYPKHEDMLKNGWRHFSTEEEVNKAAPVDEHHPGITMRAVYSLEGPTPE